MARIVISKSDASLVAYGADGLVIARCPAVFGRNPEGTKRREGDFRTPEGAYRVCFKNPDSRYHLSLGLSYPNVEDGRRALAEGAISEDEFRAIAEAERFGRIPPWKTALGGEIFIHGRGEGGDGTAGCIAIADREIEELFPMVELGTPVVIEP